MNYKEKQNFYKYLSKMTLTVWDSSVKGSYEKKIDGKLSTNVNK